MELGAEIDVAVTAPGFHEYWKETLDTLARYPASPEIETLPRGQRNADSPWAAMFPGLLTEGIDQAASYSLVILHAFRSSDSAIDSQ